MDLTVDKVHGELNAAYGLLLNLTEKQAENNLSLLLAKTALEQAKQAVLLEYAGREKDLGANEAARTAAINECCAEQVCALAKLEADSLGLRGSIECTRICVEMWRANLRLLEIASGCELVQ